MGILIARTDKLKDSTREVKKNRRWGNRPEFDN